MQTHATDTYTQFFEENEELLKSLPPPCVALEYYKAGDMYIFDELQTNSRDALRRPPCKYVPTSRELKHVRRPLQPHASPSRSRTIALDI